jgi:hypothetical protein
VSDAGAAANGWDRATAGTSGQRLGAGGRGSVALTRGPSSTVPGGANSNWIQKYSKQIQIFPNLTDPEGASLAPKIRNKIWLERSWDEEQLCLKKFPQIRNVIWTKNQRNFYELNFNRNLLEILGTSDFNEIWPASSLLHLIARKNQFPSKEDQKVEVHSKWKFDWFHNSLNPKLYFWIPPFDLGSY